MVQKLLHLILVATQFDEFALLQKVREAVTKMNLKMMMTTVAVAVKMTTEAIAVKMMIVLVALNLMTIIDLVVEKTTEIFETLKMMAIIANHSIWMIIVVLREVRMMIVAL